MSTGQGKIFDMRARETKPISDQHFTRIKMSFFEQNQNKKKENYNKYLTRNRMK